MNLTPVAQMAKAVTAALTAAVGSLGVGVTDDGISGGELVVIFLTAAAAAAAVYQVPNAKPRGKRRAAATQPDGA